MDNPDSRRRFLIGMGATSAAAFLPGSSLARTRSARRTGLARRSLNKVTKILQNHSDQLRLAGISAVTEATQADHNTPVHLLASIPDQQKIIRFFQNPKGLPFHQAHVDGNALAFRYGSREFLVENLSPDQYAERVAQIRSQGISDNNLSADYAHLYLSSDIRGRNLSDPHHCMLKGKPRLRSLSSYTDFAAIVRGMTDAAQLELQPDDKLARLWSSWLAQPDAEAADTTTDTLVVNLSKLADNLAAAQLIELLNTPLLKHALAQALGINTKTVVSHFRFLANAKRRIAPRILWLAAVLKSCPSKNSSDTLRNSYLTTPEISARRIAGKDLEHAVRLL